MSTYDQRLTAFENTLATFRRDDTIHREELNRNTTMLLGIASSQQMDIKEMKIRLLSIDDRLGGIDRRLESMEHRFVSLEDRFVSLEEKFERMLQLMTVLAKADK